MKSLTFKMLALTLLLSSSYCYGQVTVVPSPIPAPYKGSTPTEGFVDESKWNLIWSDEFDYENEDLENEWVSANHASLNLHCSRWRENAVVGDGTLRLINKKEQRGGQDWTSGSIWTKEHYKYGYFECRYRYAAATSTNNSFWIMTRGEVPEGYTKFEIDINEGHFPNNVNSNLHNWSDVTIDEKGNRVHPLDHKAYVYGATPDVHIELETPVMAHKVRLTTTKNGVVNINEMRILSDVDYAYPGILEVEPLPNKPGLENFLALPTTKVTASSSEDTLFGLTDGTPTGWKSEGEKVKWLEAEFATPQRVGCIQLNNGWIDNEMWRSILTNYKVEYYDGASWHTISTMDVSEEVNFAEEFHTHGLEWNEKELIYYLDGKEIRRTKNEYCFYPAPVFLSLAIIKWDGPLDEERLDGTFMEVDYVRIYKEKK